VQQASRPAATRLRAPVSRTAPSPDPNARGALLKVERRIDEALCLATGENPEINPVERKAG